MLTLRRNLVSCGIAGIAVECVIECDGHLIHIVLIGNARGVV